MNIFITQNSFYFVHRYFLSFFELDDSEVIFVSERKRGIFKKYLEILKNFGIINFVFITIMEVLFYLLLRKRLRKIKTISTSDSYLDKLLETKFKQCRLNQVISIGCPCKINLDLFKKYDLKILNIHGGIIPYQKGRFSPIKSLRNNHLFLGATIHFMSNSLDEGEIISQNYFKIKSKNILDNYNKVLLYSANLLDHYLRNECISIPSKIIQSFHY